MSCIVINCLPISRHYFLQEQQEEIMTEHHKMRASEVPPYAQAMVLAGLLEQYDNMVCLCCRNICPHVVKLGLRQNLHQ